MLLIPLSERVLLKERRPLTLALEREEVERERERERERARERESEQRFNNVHVALFLPVHIN